jgi:hypothetical protein
VTIYSPRTARLSARAGTISYSHEERIAGA